LTEQCCKLLPILLTLRRIRSGRASEKALQFDEVVLALREIPAGESVGYGATWVATRRSSIATIPIGYADGLSRQLGGRGHVLVRGHRAPLVGAVSMDMAMVDVTAIEPVRVRDEVVVMGAQEGPVARGVIGADEIAAAADTIPWEVLTSISRRVPRFYREP